MVSIQDMIFIIMNTLPGLNTYVIRQVLCGGYLSMFMFYATGKVSILYISLVLTLYSLSHTSSDQ